MCAIVFSLPANRRSWLTTQNSLAKAQVGGEAGNGGVGAFHAGLQPLQQPRRQPYAVAAPCTTQQLD